MLIKPKDSPFWYCDIEHKGRRIRRSSKTEDKQEAQEWHDALAHSLWRNAQLGEALPEPEVAPKTWGDAALKWATTKSRKGKERSVSEMARLVWISSHWKGKPLEDIDRHLFNELMEDRDEDFEDEVTNGTVARYRSQIMAILNVAVDLEWIKSAPRIPSPTLAEGRTDWLTKEQWDKLQAELPEHLLALARFSVATGLRLSNATHLEWSRVNMQNRTLWVDAADMKGGTAHGIPLNDDAMNVLLGQQEADKQAQEKCIKDGKAPRDPSPWVFPYRGEPIIKTSGKAWKLALERAGIPRSFTWHGLRHTWASWHRQNGTKLEDLMELGGWKSLKMVQRYAHINPTHLIAAASNVKPVSMAAEPKKAA